MIHSAFSEHEHLRRRLYDLIRGQHSPIEPVDAVVTTNEVNDRHGTGPIVKRIMKRRRNVLCIRSRDHWGGHDFGDWSIRLSHEGRSRAECFQSVLDVLSGWRVRSVLCVPFLIDELLTSIAIATIFNARLCAYIMDDQNVAEQVIPDGIMREFLEKCSLRLATHPEMACAYEQKYGLPFSILPAIVPDELIAREPVIPRQARYGASPGVRYGALLGSFWDQSWFDRLCSALKGCNARIDWFGNNVSPWVNFPKQHLRRAGITPHGIIPEDRLAVELRKYSFVMVPTGALDGRESNTGVARLSLPGRILFASATSHTPILVVGSQESCASRFVRNFGIGETVPYDAREIASAMDRLSEPETQRNLRRNAAAIVTKFSDKGIAEWLNASIQCGFPVDARVEEMFAGYELESGVPTITYDGTRRERFLVAESIR